MHTFRNSRREFLKSLGGWAVSMAVTGVTAAAKMNDKRYNVLLICVDDLRPQLGCFGHREMISPNIDTLADKGRLFTRHYVQVAVCGPSRCSMLTGKRQGDWDCWRQLREQKIEPDRPVSLPHLFRKNGYRTVCIGKISHQPGGVLEEKVHEVPFSWDLAYAPIGKWKTPWGAFFSYAKWPPVYGQTNVPNIGSTDVLITRKNLAQFRGKWPAYEAADVSDTEYADGLNAAEAIKQLHELKDQRFFLAVGFYKPHLPFNAPKKYWDLYDPEKIELAKNPFAPMNVNPEISMHPSLVLTTGFYWPSGRGKVTETEAKILRHGYFACVSYVDAQIGKVLHEVKRLGLDKNTVIVLWSDHGFHLGEHAMWGKATNFEVAVRSPLILKVPGMPKPGKRTHSLVETVDLYPTLVELCGLDAPDDLAGRSLVPMISDPDHPGNSCAYSFHPRGPLMGRTLRTERYRIVHWTNKQGKTVQVELYDHKIDPDENENIAGQRLELVKGLLDKLQKVQQ